MLCFAESFSVLTTHLSENFPQEIQIEASTRLKWLKLAVITVFFLMPCTMLLLTSVAGASYAVEPDQE